MPTSEFEPLAIPAGDNDRIDTLARFDREAQALLGDSFGTIRVGSESPEPFEGNADGGVKAERSFSSLLHS